jgi:hypothetical protein
MESAKDFFGFCNEARMPEDQTATKVQPAGDAENDAA